MVRQGRKEKIIMNIFFCGSHHLTTFDKQEVEECLHKYAPLHNIYVLCHKSLENEVLRFFMENEAYAKNLHLITLHPLDCLPLVYQEIISYLQSLGTEVCSFEHRDIGVYKSKYKEYLKEIFPVIDMVFCMYNGDKVTTVIPIDVAREQGVEAVIYELPKDDLLKSKQGFENKIRVVLDE